MDPGFWSSSTVYLGLAQVWLRRVWNSDGVVDAAVCGERNQAKAYAAKWDRPCGEATHRAPGLNSKCQVWNSVQPRGSGGGGTGRGRRRKPVSSRLQTGIAYPSQTRDEWITVVNCESDQWLDVASKSVISNLSSVFLLSMVVRAIFADVSLTSFLAQKVPQRSIH